MGRPFKEELSAMQSTFEASEKCDVTSLEAFLRNDKEYPLVVIGSGGSFAVAQGFVLCYQSLGGFAKAITPYEIWNERWVLRKAKVLIVTAGGNNSDTTGVYDYVRLYEPKGIFIVCMSMDSKISKMVGRYQDAGLLQFRVPFGKDGFLAVNSTIAMFTIIRKVCGDASYPISFSCVDEKKQIHEKIKNIRTFIVLYGGWGTPAAFDIESKCSEAGLCHIQCADYRNFAHGRHHWIAKNQDETAVIAVATRHDKKLRDRTLKLLPSLIDVIYLESEYDGINAAIDLLVKAFYLVDCLGEMRGIDPGRPHVPEFGRRLYNIKYNFKAEDLFLKKISKDRKELCIYRKLGKNIQIPAMYKYYQEKLISFWDRVERTKYMGLVLDFDGTLLEKDKDKISSEITSRLNFLLEKGILIGIATGRGDSLCEKLCDSIEKKYWNNVWIGFYNGSRIANLSGRDLSEVEESPVLKKLWDKIRQNKILGKVALYKRCQVSIRETDSCLREYYYELCCELIQNEKIQGVDVLKSGHAIDIIESGKGKQAFVDFFKELVGDTILCIGDEGYLGGNDYGMLSVNDGLSVNEENKIGDSGWNLAPIGVRNTRATAYYLGCMQADEGFFTIRFV